MESQHVRLTFSLAAAVAATAAVFHLIGKGGSGFRSLGTASHRHVAPSVSSSLALWRRLELRTLQSLTYLVAAFGPDGYNAPGCAPGCMVASPSRPGDRPGGKDENENYFFQWPRDSGLCVREVIRRMVLSQSGSTVGVALEQGKELERIVRDFVAMSVKLQHTANPSGTFETGGLGEPKFNVDGSPFDADWGRPQNDGPALRAISMLTYANYLLSLKESEALEYVQNNLYRSSVAASHSLIKDDLDYVARSWQANSYELWEEVLADASKGGHFHMLMVQRRALLAGARFAMRPEIKDAWSAGRYNTAAMSITEHLEKFWNPKGELDKEGGPEYKDGPLAIDWNDARNLSKIPKDLLRRPHVIGTLARIHGQPKPCQVDMAVLLGFTHGWNHDLASTGVSNSKDDRWAPWSDRCLLTLDRLVDVFAIVYPLNAKRSSTQGVLCGRYPEDVYDGVVQSIGHPWFLCTHAISEVLSITAHHFASLPDVPITVTTDTQRFWSKVAQAGVRNGSTAEQDKHAQAQGVSPEDYRRGDDTYERLLHGLWHMADGYLKVCDEYVGRADMMSEQIERTRGMMRGARELSWSYASFLSAIAARKGQFMTI